MNKLAKLTNIINWEILSKLGKNKFLNSFSIWLIIVPLLSNFISKIPDEILINILKKDYIFILSLPFNWVAFYFCSFFLTIGNIFFIFYCPDIIKNFNNYEEYKKNISGKYYLCKKIEQLNNDNKHNRYIDKYFKEGTKNNIFLTEKLNLLKEDSLPDIFYELRNDYNFMSPYKRTFIFVLYLVSIILLLYVFLENTSSVFNIYMSR